MSFNLSTERTHRSRLSRRSGTGFIIEALFLLVFLAAAAAVFVQLFALAAEQSTESVELSRAVAAASNTAERFAADPASVEASETVDDLIVKCTVADEDRAAGTLHKATITVYPADAADGEPVYSISTAAYEPEEAS